MIPQGSRGYQRRLVSTPGGFEKDAIPADTDQISALSSCGRRFLAKSHSRVAIPTRGGARDRGILEEYVEGLSDEPVGLGAT